MTWRRKSVTSQTTEPPTLEPTSQYLFDDNSDESTAIDSGTNGYNGTINGPTYVPHDTGYALSFDGVDDNVTIGNSIHNPEQGTIDMVVRIPSSVSGEGTIYLEATTADSNGDGYGPGGGDFNIEAVGDNIRFVYEGEVSVDDGGGVKLDSPANIGNWERYTLNWVNGGSLEIYTGGGSTPDTSHDIISYNMPPFANETIIGQAFAGNREFEGDISSISLYSEALSPEEIDSI